MTMISMSPLLSMQIFRSKRIDRLSVDGFILNGFTMEEITYISASTKLGSPTDRESDWSYHPTIAEKVV